VRRNRLVVVHRNAERSRPEPAVIPMPVIVSGNDNAAYHETEKYDTNANNAQQTSNPYSNVESPSAAVTGAVGDDGCYDPEAMYESIQEAGKVQPTYETMNRNKRR